MTHCQEIMIGAIDLVENCCYGIVLLNLLEISQIAWINIKKSVERCIYCQWNAEEKALRWTSGPLCWEVVLLCQEALSRSKGWSSQSISGARGRREAIFTISSREKFSKDYNNNYVAALQLVRSSASTFHLFSTESEKNETGAKSEEGREVPGDKHNDWKQ